MISNLFKYKCLIESSDQAIRALERAYRQNPDPAVKKQLVIAYTRAGREGDIAGLDNLVDLISPEYIAQIINGLPFYLENENGQHAYWHELWLGPTNAAAARAQIVLQQMALNPELVLRYLEQWIGDDQRTNDMIPWHRHRAHENQIGGDGPLDRIYNMALSAIANSPELSLRYARLIKPLIGHAAPWPTTTRTGRKALVNIRSDPVIYDAYLQIATAGSRDADTARWYKITIDSLRP